MTEEHDPHGLAPGMPGAKLDAGKPKVTKGALKYFPRALTAVATVSEFGARKYSWAGWREVQDGVERYDDAEGRHMLAETTDGPYDRNTHMLHAAHRAWNALAYLELLLAEGTPLHDPESADGV